MVQDLSYNLCESLVENIGGVADIGKKTPPTPITYLTQWKIVGNSEVHGNEIWSCGEYNPIDGKYHILVQPNGGSIADIALTEPLRKVNSIADKIEFADGVATVTRYFGSEDMGDMLWMNNSTNVSGKYHCTSSSLNNVIKRPSSNTETANILTIFYDATTVNRIMSATEGIGVSTGGAISVYDENYSQSDSAALFKVAMDDVELIYELETPTTETIEVPQIEVSDTDTYTQVISQGAHAIAWTEFETDPETLFAYGVQWDITQTSPDVTRIGNMELHRANKLPVQNAMRGCLLDDNGNVVQYLSDSDWQNASLLDGSHGQVMIEIPTFYWKFSEDENGIQSVMLSMVEIAGYKKVNKVYVSAYEATMDRTNTMLASVKSTDARYRGGNNNSAWDGTYRSLLGKAATNISLTEFRTYARARKANSYEWNCNTYQVQKILYWLFVVEYATRNSQKAYNSSLTSEGYRQGGLGAGVTNVNDSKWNREFSYYPFVPIGITDSLGNGTGEVSYSSVDSSDTAWATVKVPRYRGVENPFGHVWKRTDGINIQVQSDNDGGKSKVYVSDDPTAWNSSNYDGYTYIGDETRTNNWIKEVIFGENGDIVPSIVGLSSQYFADYHYTNIPTSGSVLRDLLFGGHAVNGSSAGFVCSASFGAPSLRYARVGSRLCFLPSND